MVRVFRIEPNGWQYEDHGEVPTRDMTLTEQAIGGAVLDADPKRVAELLIQHLKEGPDEGMLHPAAVLCLVEAFYVSPKGRKGPTEKTMQNLIRGRDATKKKRELEDKGLGYTQAIGQIADDFGASARTIQRLLSQDEDLMAFLAQYGFGDKTKR